MTASARGLRFAASLFSITLCLLLVSVRASSEPIPLQRVVQLALAHSSVSAAAEADVQRAAASYREQRNQYIPQVIVGSGLGASYGFPLSLEGSAPSIVNVNAMSALYNPALRDLLRATKTDWKAAQVQSKDQRNQVIQDTVLSYAELAKWQALVGRLREEQSEASKMETTVNERIQEGVDSPVERTRAQLISARIRYRTAEAEGAIDVLRNQLAQSTGLPAQSIDALPESIPALPAVEHDEDVVVKAVRGNPAVQAADIRATGLEYQARAEHRAMLPMVDFAAQYALLARFNNYDEFYRAFQRNNASLGVAIRFPFFNWSQHARAEAADADALRAKRDAQTAKNKLSAETLRLQRSVEQLQAGLEVAQLEYQISQSSLEALQIRFNAGSSALHDVEDARDQVNQRYDALQDTTFELEKARINLLRSTGELESWVGK
jgi:outer membrane protein TolC